MSLCKICYDPYNKKRKEIKFPCCDGETCCHQCFQKYLLETNSVDPKCVFCQGVLAMSHINDITTKAFRKAYRDKQNEMRFSLEQSLLSSSQEKAENERRARVIEKEYKISVLKLSMMRMTLVELNKEKKSIPTDNKKTTKELRKKMREKIDKQRFKIKELSTDILYMFRNINAYRNGRRVAQVKDVEIAYTSRPCPKEGCRGFMSKANKCGVCETYFCGDCNEQKSGRTDDTHVCDEDKKSTHQLILKSTQNCPKCSVPIFRSSGCSLMWCVVCHTQFDWNTLKIQVGYNHNPEYFRYLRENNITPDRNPLDPVQYRCDEAPDFYRVTNAFLSIPGNNSKYLECYRYFLHTRNITLRDLRLNREVDDYSKLRVKYLLSEIDLKTWKRTYKLRFNKKQIDNERYHLIDMFCNVMKDIFNNFLTNKNMSELDISISNLFKYSNHQLQKINDAYQSKSKKYFLDSGDFK